MTMAATIEEVYAERARCVAAFARMLLRHGYVVGFVVDPSEPDWPVLIAELDTFGHVGMEDCQVSWHFSKAERETLASDIPDEPTLRWDGHSTEEKYRRLDVWSRALAAR